VKALFVLLLGMPLAQAAPFGVAPVQAPFLSYTGKQESPNIPPVTTQPLSYAGRQPVPLPAVATNALHYQGRGDALGAVTTSALQYQGRGDPKGIPAVNAPALSYKGKQ
jgi:hypothetical protein